jgi:hypothetical protein
MNYRLYLRHIALAQDALMRALDRMCPDAGPTPDQEEMLEALHQTCNATEAILREQSPMKTKTNWKYITNQRR